MGWSLKKLRLKPKIIKIYLAELQLLYLDCTLDTAKLKVYSHPILQKIIASLWRLYRKRDIYKHQLIIKIILLKLILKFNNKIFEIVNSYTAFDLAFTEFLCMGKFTYNKVKNNFNLWNLI